MVTSVKACRTLWSGSSCLLKVCRVWSLRFQASGVLGFGCRVLGSAVRVESGRVWRSRVVSPGA